MKHAAWDKTIQRAIAGETVAVFGVGGLGHLAVQFAAKMGFWTVAIVRRG